MTGTNPAAPSIRTDHERTDVSVPLLVMIAIILVIVAAILLVGLWRIHRELLPQAKSGAVSFPVQMPGEATINARIESIPQPRLDSLTPLLAQPPSYRSSRPISELESPEFHPEDLRAKRQPVLNGYGWVDQKKGVARIPIEQAMNALLESKQLTITPKTGGRP
jgi:hypothetical protein